MKPIYWVAGAAGAAGVVGLILGIKGAVEGQSIGDEFSNTVNQVKFSAGRTPQDILAAVADIDPANNPILQRGYLGAPNWCNHFCALVTAALGCPVPYGQYGTRINDIITWLDAGNGGWYQLGTSATAARDAALQGQVVLATYFNMNPPPNDSGHGALVLPLEGTPMIAQAGARCFNQGTIAQGFGAIQPVFYAHL